jgi:hypothetical protein
MSTLGGLAEARFLVLRSSYGVRRAAQTNSLHDGEGEGGMERVRWSLGMRVPLFSKRAAMQ